MPLFISHRRLAKRVRLPRATSPWALDSGGFSELALFGEWRTTAEEYVAAVARYEAEIGHLAWAAPMDWMCEPFMIEKTGLSVCEHQKRTVESYLELRDRGPFIPVIQGWTVDDYEACVELYDAKGVDLRRSPLVGLGSVCRRQNTAEFGVIVRRLAEYGISLHGFGVKKAGIEGYGDMLTSADSMAWSSRARRDWPLRGHTHQSCTNCSEYALRWRDELLAGLRQGRLFDRAEAA